MALDNEEKAIMLCETKWQYLDREEAEDTLEKLQERASSVKWFNKERREHFYLIGKKISGKEGYEKKGHLVFDLEDFEKNLFNSFSIYSF